MEPKKTKLDFFIESYASFDLQGEAKDVVASHVQFLKASKALTKAKVKHYATFIAETMKGAKFAPVFCGAKGYPVDPVLVLRAMQVPDFNEQMATLIKIKADKFKTLASRKKKLSSMYRAKLAKTVSSGIVRNICDILAAFESASNNLTFKPPRAFCDTLSDIRATLNEYKFEKRELWDNFIIPNTRLMLSEQSTPIIEWLVEGEPYTVERCFKAIAKTSKSSATADIEAFDLVINKLETSLCERLYHDLNGKLVRSVNDPVDVPWLSDVDIRDVVRGEYVTAEIGAENQPVKLLNSREETARELAETETRLSYSFESEECRAGIFAGIKTLAKAMEVGLAEADDKVTFLSRFFVENRAAFLQSYLDRAIGEAVKGKGTADKSHLADLNTLLSSFSLVISPRNVEQKNVGVMGASELVHYIKFCAPWLSYKANDGGFYESAKWEGLATVHKGNGFPVGNGQPCHYPAITLTRYLTVKKTIQAEVRITNRARKRHNDNLAKNK